MTTNFKIGDPGSMIAALPGLFGFVPEQSLSVVLMKDGGVVNGMRVDLDGAFHILDQLADIAGQHGDATMAVISDVHGGDHVALTERLQATLASNGVTLNSAYVTDGVTWWCPVDPTNTGPVQDVRDSLMTFAAIMNGRPVHRTRADMAATLAQSGEQVTDEQLEAAFEYDSVELITAFISGDVDFARLAVTIEGGNGVIRDKIYGLAISSEASKVEELFVAAARALTGDARADALTMVGFFAYVRGDGPFAGEALDLAKQLNPHQSMANMLDSALQAGFAPSRIRSLAERAAANDN